LADVTGPESINLIGTINNNDVTDNECSAQSFTEKSRAGLSVATRICVVLE